MAQAKSSDKNTTGKLVFDLKVSATKRLARDLKELVQSPVVGVNAVPDEQDPFLLHCNVLVSEGIYEGLLVHLYIRIPPNYPLQSPAGNMADNFPMNHTHHEHIHSSCLCSDLLSNFEDCFSQKSGSGWNPGYTLTSLLQQLSIFFSDPDLPFQYIPSAAQVSQLRAQVATYKCPRCTHTTADPYPSIVTTETKEIQETNEAKKPSDDEKKSSEQVGAQAKITPELRAQLTCGVTKLCWLDDPSLILGCPVDLHRDRFGRMHTEPVPELISYEAYALEIQKAGSHKLDHFNQIKFSSPMGALFNNWLPVFLTKEHYQTAKTHILNALTVFKHGVEGKQEYDFDPKHVLIVLPSLINKMIVKLMDGSIHHSEAIVHTYLHFVRLMFALMDDYPQIQQALDQKVSDFVRHSHKRSKKEAGDLGEFLLLIFMSSTHNYDTVKQALLPEYFARQIFWLQKKGISQANMTKENLGQILEASQISWKLLIFNLLMSKTFINRKSCAQLDAHYGFAPKNIIDWAIDSIKRIKTITKWGQVLNAIQYQDVIKTEDQLVDQFIQACGLSHRQGYT